MDATATEPNYSEALGVQTPPASDQERGGGDAAGAMGTTTGEATPRSAHQHLLRVVARTASMHIFAERLVPADEALDIALSWIAMCPELRVEVMCS
jgi:hypothetical protein